MKIHKSITKESLRLALTCIMECGADGAPVLAMPGIYHGRPVTVIALHDDQGESVTIMPLAIVLDPGSDDAAYVTLDGATACGSVAPSAPQGVPDAALALLLDAVADGTLPRSLRERAERVLAGRPVAPAAPLSTGLYL